MIKYSFENAERPKIRRPKYSQNLLDCRPNDARYAFLRPGQIQLANFRAGGRIKDIGLTENEFKTRFNLHKSYFKLEHKRTSTTPSEHVWKLKNKNINFNIKWEVVKKVKPFAPSDKVRKLCLQEKLSMLRSAPSLNKRSGAFALTSHCQLMRVCDPKLRVLTTNYRLSVFNSLY